MASNKDTSRDYEAAKAALKAFLAQFHTVNPDTGRKDFVYARQITNIAHRDQVHTVDEHINAAEHVTYSRVKSKCMLLRLQ